MTGKYTPGPWVAVRNSAYWEVRPDNGGEGDIPYSIGDVCASAPKNPDGGLQESNARLIAAAPDMLEALADMVVVAQEAGWSEAMTGRQLILKNAIAAISKAEGRV